MKGGGRYKEGGVEGRKWGLLIEWIREYNVVSGSQDFTCDIGDVGISFNFLTAENLSTDRLANGYLPSGGIQPNQPAYPGQDL